jgi:hypothetical protein
MTELWAIHKWMAQSQLAEQDETGLMQPRSQQG